MLYLVQQAASLGANIILLQELFQTPYFAQQERPEHFKLAASSEVWCDLICCICIMFVC